MDIRHWCRRLIFLCISILANTHHRNDFFIGKSSRLYFWLLLRISNDQLMPTGHKHSIDGRSLRPLCISIKSTSDSCFSNSTFFGNVTDIFSTVCHDSSDIVYYWIFVDEGVAGIPKRFCHFYSPFIG